MQKICQKIANPFAICRILTSLYSAFLSYMQSPLGGCEGSHGTIVFCIFCILPFTYYNNYISYSGYFFAYSAHGKEVFVNSAYCHIAILLYCHISCIFKLFCIFCPLIYIMIFCIFICIFCTWKRGMCEFCILPYCYIVIFSCIFCNQSGTNWH